jgi:hypothetical protein
MIWRSASARAGAPGDIMHGLVLIGLAIAARPLPLSGELTALIGAGGTSRDRSPISWLLIGRDSGVARIR